MACIKEFLYFSQTARSSKQTHPIHIWSLSSKLSFSVISFWSDGNFWNFFLSFFSLHQCGKPSLIWVVFLSLSRQGYCPHFCGTFRMDKTSFWRSAENWSDFTSNSRIIWNTSHENMMRIFCPQPTYNFIWGLIYIGYDSISK